MSLNPQNVTIDDVANEANVSRATAGRVIGGYGSVSEKSKQKVLEAIEKLNYRPNTIAQSLRSHRTKTIAVVLGNIKNHYCNSVVYAVEKEANKSGYNVLICNTNENELNEVRQMQSILSRQVDGVILMSTYHDDEEIPQIYKDIYINTVPMVLADREIKGLDIDVIMSNNEESSYNATKYLISLGHRKIGVIGSYCYSTVRDRINGYTRALIDAGIEVDESLVMKANYAEIGAGENLFYELMSRHKDVTALYVLNDTLNSSVLVALKKKGLRIPEDISVLAWDDVDVNELMGITTIIQPIEEIGKKAVGRLFEMMKHPEKLRGGERMILGTEMVVRQSCASPKHLNGDINNN